MVKMFIVAGEPIAADLWLRLRNQDVIEVLDAPPAPMPYERALKALENMELALAPRNRKERRANQSKRYR